ncbi:MAG: C-terminal helicase domain-containing protein, partial [Acidobacteriota bacterium]|nr:C-terminal helicase domain-containing protein [Acidobacteriota bacterium]
RTEAILHCVLDESERALYDSILLSTRREVVKQLEAGGGVMGILEALLRLRQVACHRALVDQTTDPTSEPLMSSKLHRLMLALEDTVAAGHKALIFSQWTRFLDLVEPHLSRCSLPFERLDGKTRDRATVVSRFQATTGPPVMLISLKAGGVGLNLTAADHVFLLDPWWNPATEAQAADRTHRIGQDKPVMIYRMVSRNTVEERILELQQRKQELAAAVLSDGAATTSLTRDDLLMLLQ